MGVVREPEKSSTRYQTLGLGDANGCKWLTFRSTAWIWLQWAITPNSMACESPGMGGVGFQSRQKYTAGNFHGFRVGGAGEGTGKKMTVQPTNMIFQAPKTTPLNQQIKKATCWLSGYGVCLGRWKCFGHRQWGWLCNLVNVSNATKLYILKEMKWSMWSYSDFATIKINKEEQKQRRGQTFNWSSPRKFPQWTTGRAGRQSW